MAKILIADDDKTLTVTIDDWVSSQSHTTDIVHNGEEALFMLKSYSYDIVVLDWVMPDMTGIDVLKEIRSKGNSIPVIMLTGQSEIDDKAVGFESGADDYLTKPFEPRELLMRIDALLRRPKAVIDKLLKVGDLSLDVNTRKVERNGRLLKLNKQEFAVLEFLMRNQGQAFDSRTLIERVWSSNTETSPESVRMHISRLRKKIDQSGDSPLVHTEHKVGYKIEDLSGS